MAIIVFELTDLIHQSEYEKYERKKKNSAPEFVHICI